MKIQPIIWRSAAALALALLAAGCSPNGVANQPPATPAASAVIPPAATALPAATAQPAATALPAATATPVPPSPTALPAATAAPTADPSAKLPTDKLWVRSGDTIIAAGDARRELALRAPDYPAYRYAALAAPDGSRIAYVDDQDQLTVADVRGGTRALPKNVAGYSFSPDGRSLAFTLTDGQRWQLQTIELASGATRTLQEGGPAPQASDQLPLTLRPIAWTDDGILAEQILWASDAPPQGLVLVRPDDGSSQPLRKQPHIQAAVAPGGQQIAVVTGETPIGPDAAPTMEIRIFAAGSGGERVIVPSRPGFVREMRWSPDGAWLLYAASEGYDSPTAAVTAIKADGSGERRVEFKTQGFEMALQDLGWRDADTALVLLGDAGAKLELHALPLSSFDAGSMRLLETLQGQLDVDHRILYAPRGA